MWGNFMEMAEKAKKVAERLDHQLNASVGIESTQQAEVWDEDDEIFDSGPETIQEDVEEEEAVDESVIINGLERNEKEKAADDLVVEPIEQQHSEDERLPSPPPPPPAFASEKPYVPSKVSTEPQPQDPAPDMQPGHPTAIEIPIKNEAEAEQTDQMPEEKTADDAPTEDVFLENISDIMDEPKAVVLSSEKENKETVTVEQEDIAEQPDLSRDVDAPAPKPPQLLPLHEHQPVPPVTQNEQQGSEYTQLLETQLELLQKSLIQREEQLFSKTDQLTNLQNMYDTEKADLLQKLQHTKDEAKKRIQKAKDRVEAMELKLADESQTEIIVALREEGEKLARKQADMEASVRTAKGESRELKQELEATTEELQSAKERISTLEMELKSTRDDLSSARQGESQAGKLDSDLRTVREESEKRAATILNLEAKVKELKLVLKELNIELENTKMGAASSSEQERKKLRKEHSEMLIDLEQKIRKTEQQAEIREEGLRQEVDELRKRWQDAIRRADALAVDVQSSTAPLLRQLESTNKQNRARAAAWAELETQLRSELEESVINIEKLSKERTDWKTKATRLDRANTEMETELKQVKNELYEKSELLKKLQSELYEMKEENEKKQAEWAEVERLANEGVSRVRSEMTRTVVDAEERHKNQMENLESQFREQSRKRAELEKQVEKLLANDGVMASLVAQPDSTSMKTDTEPKELRQSEGQLEILAGALGELGDEDDSDDEHVEYQEQNGRSGSFAAVEQLTSRLKAAKVELETLRKRFEESEKTREEMVALLSESRSAREKLPLFESKVKELTMENKELSQEVEGLRGDIVEVQELYRSQLNMLLEAQTSNGGRAVPAGSETNENVPNGEAD